MTDKPKDAPQEAQQDTVQACKACGCLVPSDLFVLHVEFHKSIAPKPESKLVLPK